MRRASKGNRTRQRLAGSLAVLLLLFAYSLQPRSASDTQEKPARSDVSAKYAALPLAFEPNQGQVGDGVDFLVHHGQAVTAFSGTSSTTSVGGKRVTMSLDGASASSFAGQDELPSKTNYFLGNDQAQWHSDIPNFQKLLAKNVYPGIDLAYYGTNSTLEHDFIVSPNADYHQIAFNFSGQDKLTQDEEGNLVLNAGDDELRLNAPNTYQLGDHEKHTIPSKFELSGNTVTMAITGDYDHAKPLVIDPVLVYSTYLGGSGDDTAYGIAVDASGFAYVSGSTASADFPTTAPFQGSNGGTTDIFVSKLDQTGSSLTYSTYIGGSGTDSPANPGGLAVDSAGNAYLTGYTQSSNYPVASPVQGSLSGTSDAVITKLNASGSSLTYSTYLGGSSSEFGRSIAVDASGNAYVAGETLSSNFPTASPYQASHGGGSIDAFVAKLNAAGSSLTYSTYLGGSGTDSAYSLAVDTSGNAFVTGVTTSSNFPTASPYQASNAGGQDAFLTKLNAAGSSLTYSTYLGGSGSETGRAITVDTAGSPYITGFTSSTNFPVATPLEGSLNGGVLDAFLTKFAPAGTGLTYSTYLGGNGVDTGNGVAVDSGGNAYVAGSTGSTDLITASPYQASNGGGTDGFVMKIDGSGLSFLYSSYLGGTGTDSVNWIAAGLNGNLYTAGSTNSADFPTASPLQGATNGGTDSFVAQLSENTVTVTGVAPTGTIDPTLSFSVSSPNCYLGVFSPSSTSFCTHTMDASTNSPSGYVISYRYTTGLLGPLGEIDSLATPTASTTGTEQFGMNLAANTAAVSHTSTDFGANPSGGTGAAYSDYGTSNLFTFKPDNLPAVSTPLAYTPAASATTTYTASFMANVAPQTPNGYYAVGMIYIITASF